MTIATTAEDPLGLAYRPLSGAEVDRMHRFKEMGMEMIELMRATGTSRELEVAQTRLEEAVIWAVKHVALHGIDRG